MIKLCQNFNISDYKSESFYCALLTKIYSLSVTNKNMNTLLYQITDSENRVRGFILSTNGEVNVCSDDLFDRTEIVDFLLFFGYESVLSNISLPFNGKTRCGYEMKYVKRKAFQSKAGIISCEEIKDIYPLMTSCFEIRADFPEWFCSVSHKVRHGYADISALKVNDKFVSCAVGMYKTPFSCIISGVCTDKNYRNNAYAGSCLNAVIKKEKLENINDIYVFCEEGETESFYKKKGFEKNGRWYEYVR